MKKIITQNYREKCILQVAPIKACLEEFFSQKINTQLPSEKFKSRLFQSYIFIAITFTLKLLGSARK